MNVGRRYTSILAGFVGNVIEWYDFALYGYMAGTLAGLFFPGDDRVASLIATYGVFAAGFVMRPLGSGIFGWLGDTIGRSRTMLISVSMMALPTFLLGCLPTYAQAGLLAPALLVLVRLIQGLSVGGEFSSSVTYLVETAPKERRGLAGSWANTGSIFGMLLGSGIAAGLTTLMPAPAVQDWGWRLPFLFGGVLGTAAIVMRRNLPRSEHFQKHHSARPSSSPLIEAFTTNRHEMIQAIVFASAYGVLFYLPLVYLPQWLNDSAGMPLDQAMRINTAGTALLLALIPVSGWIGDRLVRRNRWIASAMLVVAIVSFPLYFWVLRDGLASVWVTQISLAAMIAVPLGSAPGMFVELFPARDRLSGYSVAYNIGLGVVGGSAPMAATWLIDVSGRPSAPAVLMAVIAVVGFVAVLTMRDRSRDDLR